MELQFKLWLEHGGGIAVSSRRVELLEAVAATGSLTEAAERLGWPYRRAWGKLREMELHLGLKLVETSSGGAGGGHSRLTPAAEELIARYHRFSAEIEPWLQERLKQAFQDWPPSK